MKDKTRKTLKAYYNGELYHVGTMNTLKGKVQVAMPVSEDSREAYTVKVVKLKDVILTLE